MACQLTSIAPVYAGPTGGTVVGGEGNIDYQGANTTINQASNRLAIDWQTFNVAEDESVQFIQPGQDAFALNRILDQNPSQIFGRIDANGNVMLMNARGIIFGRSASINVGGLVASSLDVDPNEFMNSQSFTFSAIEGTDGVVINNGLINAATGGSVSLIGKSVQNDGIIVANLGKVNLAAGSEAVLTFGRDGLMGVEVTKEVLENDIGVDSAVLNSGTIKGEGAQVALTAKVSRDLFSNAVNNTGIIQAASIQERNGAIYLLGSGANTENHGTLDVSSTEADVDGGTVGVAGDNVNHSGVITADAQQGNGGVVEIDSQDTTIMSGDSTVSARSDAGGSGGIVKVLGDKVGLFEQSSIDTSGSDGGGTVLVGGDYQGSNPDIKNASRTYVGKHASINADATTNGNGGKVVVWSDEITRYYGEISARPVSGNGGLAEVSGKQWLDFDGAVDLSSDSGAAGVLLLDPRDLTITNTTSNDVPQPDVNGISVAFDYPSTSLSIPVTATSIENILKAGTSLELQASRDIIVNSAINATGTGSVAGGDLTLRAIDDITISAPITMNNGDLFLFADDGGTSDGFNGDISIRDALITNGGRFEASGRNIASNASGYINTGGGDTLFNAIGSITLNNINNNFDNIDISNATTVSIRDSDSLVLNNVSNSDTVTIDAQDSITVAGTIDSGGTTLTLNAGQGGSDSTVDIQGATINRNLIVNGGAGSDTLVGFNQDTTWSITSPNAGNFGSSPNRSFSSIENLTGGDFDDVFIFSGTGSLAGTLNGGQGSDRAEYNALSGLVTVDLNNVVDVENVIGSSDVLVGADVGNTWNITGSGAGDVLNSGDGVTTVFTGFTTITGGAQQDDFTIDADVGGVISGGAEADTFTLNSDMVNAVNGDAGGDTFNITVNNTGGVFGGADDDTFVLSDGITATSIDGGGGTNDVLNMSAYSIDTIWNITSDNAGNVTDTAGPPPNTLVTFTGVERANSGSGSDEFVFADGVNLSGSVNGNAGTDTLNYSAYNSALTVDLATLINFEIVTGGSASDTLIGSNFDSTWNINVNDSGTVGTVSFSDFENLTGGTGDDDFVFADSVNISGVLDGGDGVDSADYSAHTADLTLQMANILNIEDLTGGAGNDTLVGQDTPNSWTITGSASGSVNTTDFTSIENLTGGGDTDNFAPNNGVVFGGIIDGGLGTDTMDYSAFNTALTIDATSLINIEQVIGGSASDTLFAGDNINTWNITDLNEGNVNGFGFSGVENLRGGSANDDFVFANNNAAITGTADGQGASNTLDYSALTDDVVVDRANPANSTGVGSFVGINNVIAGSGANDTLVGLNSDETWQLSGANSGSATGLTFSDFENLTGGSGQDSFEFSDAWVTVGVIDGGANTDTLNYSALTSGVIVDLNTLVNFEDLIGSNQVDTLIATDSNNNWNLAALNEGNVNGFTFTGIENLTGGGQDDSFAFQASSSVSGLIDGGQGTDTLDYSTYGADVALDLQSNTATATGGITNLEVLVGSTGANDALTGANSVNTWTIDGNNSGNVNSAFSFSDIETVNGGSQDDTYYLTDTGSLNGAINGGNGTDVIDYSQRTLQVAVDLNGPSATGMATFSGIESFVGSLADDTFTAANVDNTWQITGSDSGSVAGFSFSSFENLIGGSARDEFIFDDGVVFGGVIDAGTGTNTLNYGNYTTGVTIDLSGLFGFTDFVGSGLEDTLIGDNVANDWSLTGANQGSVNNSGGTFTFSAIENLVGGNTTDTFSIAAGASVDGVIDGGSGTNTLDYSTYGSAITVDLAQNTATGTGSIGNITAVTGSAAVDTLSAANTTNSWDITATDTGSVNTFDFSGIEMLTGGTADDVFVFTDGVGVSGTVNGGGGIGIDTLDYSQYTSAVTVDLGAGSATATGAIVNIENAIGGLAADTLVAADAVNTWNIAGNNSGTVNSFTFRSFENLSGGAMADTFNVSADAIIGSINGGDGNDTLSVTYGTGGRTVDFDGANGVDTVALAGNAPTLQSQYIFSDATPNDLTNTMGNQTVVMHNIEQADDQVISAGIEITASDSADAIQLASSTISGTNPMAVSISGANTFVPLHFSNKPDVTIIGSGGNDSVDIVTDVAVSGALYFDVETINTSPYTIRADQLTIRNATAVGNLNQLLLIDTNALQLADISGDVYIQETTNGLNMLDSNIFGDLQLVNVSGDVTATGAISVGGDATFIGANNSSFTVNNANNNLQGEVSFTVTDPVNERLNNVDVANADSLLLGNIISNNLDITTAGDIGNGANVRLDVSGLTRFDAGGGNVVLDGASTDLGAVAASNVNELNVTDTNDIGLGEISASTVVINAGGQISNAGSNIVADSATLNAQDGVGDNSALQTTVTSLSVTNAASGDININNTGSLTIAAITNAAPSTNGGNVTVASSQSITQTGQVSAGNNVDLTAGGNYDQQANINATNNVSLAADNGAITMQDGTRTDSQGATISYTSADTVTVSSLDAIFGQGRVEVSSGQGNIISSRAPDLSQPNITGDYAVFDAPFGSLGEPGRPLVINVPGTVVINTFTSVAPIYIALPSNIIDTSRLLFDINEAIAEVGGNQRTEVDALAIIDPAVFTHVKNYSEDLYPVKLPPDQLLSEDEEQKKQAEDPDIFDAEPAK